jgi:hypothetical protein
MKPRKSFFKKHINEIKKPIQEVKGVLNKDIETFKKIKWKS